jgi:hypothetical protein
MVIGTKEDGDEPGKDAHSGRRTCYETTEGLSSEHAGLVAQRDFLVAWIELVERQRANVQEAIEIDRKLAEMGQRSLSALETLAGLQQGEAAIAP